MNATSACAADWREELLERPVCDVSSQVILQIIREMRGEEI